MSIFQKSIVKKHISSINQELLKEKWNLFTSYFHNATIQENIHNSKEEQFQEGFLRELFVKVLGYTLNPEPNFNLTTEYKNIKDSKKADGAIIINDIVTAVIELKGTGTTDLGKVESQAFNYKNNQHKCVYVITSNFEKLRFYIDNAIEHIEFNLFKLTEEEFQLLYLCLAFKNIENNVPKNIKDESVSQEDVITKKLYNDYSLFKRELHHNLVALNPGNDPLELFQKSQKLLDRFLFIFFAEDRGLLPTNLIFRINKEWQQLREMRIDVSLYDRYKIYFSDLNVGAKVSLPAFSQTASNKKDEFQIYAYNGGLFKEDDELNTLKIDDALLFRHTEKLSNYDFASEVDVNILGHIFENSLNELDEIKAQLEGQEIDKTKTKRKKDGVFYTPKYITKYIVDNTVGKLCIDKKVEFKINEEDYITDKKRNKTTIQNLAAKLTEYRNWLLQITICDPACGSGAFLNQALDFLINEHKYIDELQAKLFGDALILSDVEQSILENNLFGVDINEESVEIAKLSLWLRTAQPNRKLNDLNSNIKCGNSLIDDVAVAGDKAFNWENEFKEVFENGGFDIIIGNPPYGVNFNDIEKKYLSNFDSLVPDFEIYIYFISLYKRILSKNGLLSYIFPNTFLSTLFGKKYRMEIFNDVDVYQIIDLSNDVTFTDASVRTCIFSFKNINVDYVSELLRINNFEFETVGKYTKNDILSEIENLSSLFFQNKDERAIIDKLQKNKILRDYFEVSQGYIPYRRSDLVKNFGDIEGNRIVDERLWHSNSKIDENWKKEILGKDINRYLYKISEGYIKYGKQVASYVNPKFFEQERILIREITSDKLFCVFVEESFYNNPSLINIINEKKILELKFAITLLNSKLIGWLHNKVSPKANKGLFPKILINDVRNIPLVETTHENQTPFIDKANLMMSLTKELQSVNNKFTTYFCGQYKIEKLSNKLEQWYILDFADFVIELNKIIKTVKGVPLTKKDEFDWIDLFNENKQKAQALKSQIDVTDKEIDQMVYKLYDLTEEEIKIVEGI
jgi:type I restriction-modification system DNA methylase subunit